MGLENMRVTLVAIQELHKPVSATFGWNTGMQLWDPCPTCQGKAGVHECGCWGDYDTEFFCAECSDFEIGKGKRVPYPCATRRLADDARTTKNGDT